MNHVTGLLIIQEGILVLVQSFRRYCLTSQTLFVVIAFSLFCCRMLVADDYFLTIGGGYSPTGNQASLEENVVFFQQVLSEKDLASRPHEIFFADGDDDTADLQVVAAKPSVQPDRPATQLLASLHRRRGQQQVEYRNHRVPRIRGALKPALIRASLEAFVKTVRPGDRLIIYVTAHGSEGPEGDEFNTTIDCWDQEKITAREFSQWLDLLPFGVPTVMVMAQCYCGGFSRTVFDGLEAKRGLSSHLRVGFFAQQHHLPAAGCRPDIEHDQEFSSYFWGAIAGRSRVGKPVDDCDIDGNGVVSFAEAYAYAVWAGETIDIPLTTSDVLLRTYSRMPGAKIALEKSELKSERVTEQKSEAKEADTALGDKSAPRTDSPALTGTLQSFVDRGRPIAGRIVTRLSSLLKFSLDDDASSVVAAYDDHWQNRPSAGFGRGGRRGAGSSRRELLKEVSEKWPELGDQRHWEESPLLKDENQEQLLEELKQLPSWKAYDERRRRFEESGDRSERHELREVKFRRLIKTLELILLEQNLPQVAAPEIVQRYREMIALEESTLGLTK